MSRITRDAARVPVAAFMATPYLDKRVSYAPSEWELSETWIYFVVGDRGTGWTRLSQIHPTGRFAVWYQLVRCGSSYPYSLPSAEDSCKSRRFVHLRVGPDMVRPHRGNALHAEHRGSYSGLRMRTHR